MAVPTSLLPSFFLKNFTPPAIRAATTASATIRRIVRRRFFLSAVLFSALFAGVSGDAGAAVSAGVSSFFSSMISAMTYSPFTILRAEARLFPIQCCQRPNRAADRHIHLRSLMLI